jgi:hypothetical protein
MAVTKTLIVEARSLGGWVDEVRSALTHRLRTAMDARRPYQPTELLCPGEWDPDVADIDVATYDLDADDPYDPYDSTAWWERD